MTKSGELEFYEYSSPDQPLNNLPLSPQNEYIQAYLSGLKTASVILEPAYFDKDYLDEFSAFYSRSSQSYPNICQRLHFFGPESITRKELFLALSGKQELIDKLNDNYLGFIVKRPIPIAPFGRTVLAFYPDLIPATPRITTPSRKYEAHLAGLTLAVEGLPWQQQDTGVAACATVGLWSMFHSSAFDDFHAIPTTAEITKSARVFGARPFPSRGLTVEQILEAINQQKLNPIAVSGDLSDLPFIPGLGYPFSKERFANNVAAFLRSGYPLLIAGKYAESNGIGHATCIVGFRDKAYTSSHPGKYDMADGHIEHVYVHDDNYGANIRFEIRPGTQGEALMVSAPPEYTEHRKPNPEVMFIPYKIIAAVHEDVRISADDLYIKGDLVTKAIVILINNVNQRVGIESPSFTFSTRFCLLRDYFEEELPIALEEQALAKTRLYLQEHVPPMSLHLGVVRIGINGKGLLMDILFDTTDSGRSTPVFASVIYDKSLFQLLNSLAENILVQNIGVPKYLVPAF